MMNLIDHMLGPEKPSVWSPDTQLALSHARMALQMQSRIGIVGKHDTPSDTLCRAMAMRSAAVHNFDVAVRSGLVLE